MRWLLTSLPPTSLLFCALLACPALLWASDSTKPTTPVVTDDGASTGSKTQLHATWTSSDPESGITQYQYKIWRGSTSGTVIVAWTSTGTTASVTKTGLSLGQGKTYYFGVKAKNGAGLWSAVGYADGIAVDATAPSAVIVTDEGATTSSTTQLGATWTTSIDADSGIAEYQYCIRQDATTGTIIVNWTSVGTNTSVTRTGLSLVNGKTYYIGVQAKNGSGLFSTPAYADGITVKADTTPPTGTITINSGAAYTNATAVTLTLSATDDSGLVSQMQLSNDGTTYSTPEAYATTKSWTLTTGDGGKTVYAKCKDAAGNWSSAVSDTITLDTTAPTTPVVTDDGVYTTSTTQLHASWTVSDAESSIAESQYQITQESATGTVVIPWTSVGAATAVTKTGLALTDGATYYVSVKAKNGAGDWSKVGAADGIMVDTTPPSGTLTINNGATYTLTTSVTLTISATDTSGTVSQMRFSNDTVTWSAAEAYATTKSWTLTTSDGTKTVYAQFQDPAGNWSSAVSDTITLDTTPPSITVTSPLDGAILGAQ